MKSEYLLLPLLAVGVILAGCKRPDSVTTEPLNGLPLLSPAPGAATAIPFPHFTWTPHPDSFADPARPVRYEIQIARDTEFRDLVDEDTLMISRYVPDRPLPNETLSWRVRAIPSTGEALPWSESRPLSITPCDEIIHVAYDPSLADHQPAAQEAIDRAVALNQLGKSVEVIFPKEIYRGNSPKKMFLQIKGANGLVVNGNGATIHLQPFDATFAHITDSKNVVVRDFTVDMPEQLPFSQGRVVAVDPESATAEVLFEEGFPTFDDDWFRQAKGSLKLLDPKIDGRLKTGVTSWFLIAPETIEKITDRHYRVNIAPPSYQVERGKVVLSNVKPSDLVKHFQVGDRFVYALGSASSALVFAMDAEAVTYYQITNHAAIRHFWALMCSEINVLHCALVLKEGRWFNGLSDGVHCRGNRIGPWIEGLEINGIGDDGIALYSRPMTIASPDPSGDPHRLVIKADLFAAQPGDEVTFFRPQTGTVLMETKVKSIAPTGADFSVEFQDPVPAGLNITGSLIDSDQIWNRSLSSGDFVVRNNRLTNIRRFGVIFRAKGGIVENNLFSGTSASAVIALNETQYPNGLYPSEIIIRNNEIRDCAFDTMPTAVITMLFKRLGGSEPAGSAGPHGILLENNRISGCLRPALELWSTRGIVLHGNTVNGQPLEESTANQVILKNVSDIQWLETTK